MKNFDLNIDKILENWEVFHAIRELIANAIDEQILTKTQKPMIFQDEAGWWHIRDFGRGLRYQDLIQTENPEKLEHANLIGKFGIGLKDALATFDRRGITVLIRSRHGDISLARVSKHSFEELVRCRMASCALSPRLFSQKSPRIVTFQSIYTSSLLQIRQRNQLVLGKVEFLVAPRRVKVFQPHVAGCPQAFCLKAGTRARSVET